MAKGLIAATSSITPVAKFSPKFWGYTLYELQVRLWIFESWKLPSGA